MPELDPIKDYAELQTRLAGPMTFLMLLVVAIIFAALGIQMLLAGNYRDGAKALGCALLIGAAFGLYMAHMARRTHQLDAQEADRDKRGRP